MHKHKLSFLGVALLGLLGACAPLTAEAPLFSLADQVGPPPLSVGVWRQGGEGCAHEGGTAMEACARIELSRTGDGAWLYVMRSPEADEVQEQLSWRVIVAPALESDRAEYYAPLYVAEYVSLDEPGRPLYAVVAPVGAMPAREVRMLAMIDCDDALREGPIPGVSEVQGEEAFDRVCVARSRTAVREAARRALIENLSLVLGDVRTRFIWVSPPADRDAQIVAEAR
jgi:hypothetical protein